MFEWETPLVCPDEVRTEGCSLRDEQLYYSFNLSSLSKSTFKVSPRPGARDLGGPCRLASLSGSSVCYDVASMSVGESAVPQALWGSGGRMGVVLTLSWARARPASGAGQHANQSRLVPELCPTVQSKSFSWAWQGFSYSVRRVTGPLPCHTTESRRPLRAV